MGLAELKEWATSHEAWREKLSEWTESRDAALPELHSIVDRFLRRETSASDFRHAMDSFGKRTRYAGFHGIAGQMFFNTLVKAAEEQALAEALRAAIPVPADDAACRSKFSAFLTFVEEARERAQEIGVRQPSLGYAPYFLSFFWEAQDREAWPIYYPASRDTLARHGLFVDEGPLVERYLKFREQTLLLRHELGADTWGVEALLWQLEQENKDDSDGDTRKRPGPEEAEGDAAGTAPRRAWLMRGNNIGGENYVPYFLADGFIAVGWDAPTPLSEGMTRAAIAEALRDAYPEESSGTIRNWVGIDHRFVNLVAPGDLVLTPNGQDLYIGRVLSGAEQTPHGENTIVRRSVEWLNRDAPVQRSQVRAEFPSLHSKMRTLLTLTDLREDAAIVAALAGLSPPPPPPPEPGIPAVTQTLADRLFLPVPWLQEVIDVLNEKRQLVFYGPPVLARPSWLKRSENMSRKPAENMRSFSFTRRSVTKTSSRAFGRGRERPAARSTSSSRQGR